MSIEQAWQAAERKIGELETQLAAANAQLQAAEAKLAAVPWGAIGRILDRIETPEDRYAVALWHLENRGM